MEFEYDAAKGALNFKKHGLTFEEAATIFGDPMAYTFADPDHSVGEERWLVLGMSHSARLFAVIYTHRGEKYRIISARLATKRERKIYEEE